MDYFTGAGLIVLGLVCIWFGVATIVNGKIVF
jgi:hypothetical protein